MARLLAIAVLLLNGCGPLPDESVEEETTSTEALTVRSPVPGYRITTPFGREGNLWAAGYHTGDDYSSPTGAKVVATRGGRVVGAGWNILGAAYGKQVIVETNGIRHLYAHLSRITVSAGSNVDAGDKLGEVGETGNAYGSHLHYEERHSPYGYYDHRRPRFNRTSVTPERGFKNWIFHKAHRDNVFMKKALESAGCKQSNPQSEFYGDGAREAVRCFQRKQGWTGAGANGFMGPQTAARLHLTGDVYVRHLRAGVTNSKSVRILQQRMNEVRSAGLQITGDYDVATRDAVRAWQRSIGDSGAGADGNMGPLQSERLFPAHRYRVH